MEKYLHSQHKGVSKRSKFGHTFLSHLKNHHSTYCEHEVKNEACDEDNEVKDVEMVVGAPLRVVVEQPVNIRVVNVLADVLAGHKALRVHGLGSVCLVECHWPHSHGKCRLSWRTCDRDKRP